MTSLSRYSVGIVGARGFVGAELIRLLDTHPRFELAFVSSRSLAGRLLSRSVPGCASKLQFEHLTPADVGDRAADITVLALPNGLAQEFAALIPPDHIVIDLSADFRFDDQWYYGLPELYRDQANGSTRISNPGCYATAMQLALAPIADLLDGPPACFGVSGYSGAGSIPSDKNDPKKLLNNLLPYAPVGHMHEREVSRHIGHAVHFMPHVAPFYRGISMTVDARLNTTMTLAEISERYETRYRDEPLVRYQDAAPTVADAVHKPGASVGGCTLSAGGDRLVVYCTLDNLLKGAATQALQNMNRACQLGELEGIRIG